MSLYEVPEGPQGPPGDTGVFNGDASDVPFSPTGTIAATDVQAAIAEVASEASSGGDTIAALFGAPDTAYEFDTSSLTGLTAVGSSPDVEAAHTVVPGHYYVERRTNSGGIMGRYAAVTAPFTAIIKLTDSSIAYDYNKAFMFIGASGVVNNDVFGISSQQREIFCHRWNTASGGYSSDSGFTTPDYIASAPIYLAIKAASNTDVDYLWSYSGRVWSPLGRARNPGITIALVGVGVACENASNEIGAAFDFLRIWNSTKTFLGAA